MSSWRAKRWTGWCFFLDESGAHTQMTRLRGRALGGQRLLARIAGLRLGGACAPWLFGGAMKGEMFLAWVRQGLAPTLRAGDVVILDNLARPKIRGVRQTLEAVGAQLLYLPPYSPDFNPIERMWSKIQQVLCGHAPRTEDELLRAAPSAFNALSTAGRQGFFFSAQLAT